MVGRIRMWDEVLLAVSSRRSMSGLLDILAECARVQVVVAAEYFQPSVLAAFREWW